MIKNRKNLCVLCVFVVKKFTVNIEIFSYRRDKESKGEIEMRSLFSINFYFALFLICMLRITVFGAQETIEGYWEGAIVREGAVQIIRVDLFKDDTGLKARLEVGDFTKYDLPVVPVVYESGKIQFNTSAGKAVLTLDSVVGEMIGTVGSGVPPIGIHLKRALRPFTVPVKTEDVEFKNGDVTLSGTLVTPPTAGPHPAIVWIHGRGKSSRRGFSRIARVLAQRGIASLIYDKRGVGKSSGDHDQANLFDHAGDALAGIDFLAKRKEIDPKQIGLNGSSAGGWVVPIVANRSKIPVAFIITHVGPADSVRDQQIHVAKYHMLQSGIDFTKEEYAGAIEHMSLVQEVAYTGKGWEALRASVAKAKETRWASFVDLPEDDNNSEIVWVRRNQYDPAPDLKKVKVPFLAFYGERDYIVPHQENVKKLEQYLKEAGNKDFKTVVLPLADHGLEIPGELRHLPGKNSDDYYWLWDKSSPGLVEITLDWLLKRVTIAPEFPGVK
jgi:uncharacterized protein